MAKVRTAILVTFVSILIWAFAEGQSLQTKRTVADVEFPGATTGPYAVRILDDQSWRGRVELQIEGSTASLDGLQAALRRALILSPGAEGIPRESGEYTVDLRIALRGHPDFRTRGITVLSAEPPNVRVIIEELTSIKVPVRVDVPAGEIDGPADPKDAQATVRLPARAAARLPVGASVLATIRPEDLARFEAGRRVTLRSVRLEPGPDFAGIEPLEIAPSQTDITLAVRSKTETISIPAVPVDVRIAPAELARWEIEVPQEEQDIRDVQVTGPSEWIAQIRDGKLVVGAYIRLSFEDLERGVTSKQAEFTDLPSPLTIRAEDREVRLTVRRREPAGAPEGLSPPN